MSRKTKNAVNESKNTDSEEKPYPSPKEAIFSDSIPNLRCAIEYVIWQLSYMLLAVFGGLIVGVTTAGYLLVDSVCETSRKSGLAETVQRVVEDERVITGAKYAAMIGMGAIAVGALGAVGYSLYVDFWAIAKPLGIIGGAILGAVSIVLGGAALFFRYERRIETAIDRVKTRTRSSARSVADRGGAVGLAAQNTPGVRRIYGKCPVHASIQPKWFASLLERIEDDD